jgi:predicted dehydrogenase
VADRVVRIAFVGCGMVSEAHASAIRESPRAGLAGVFDPDESVADRRSEAWSCRRFSSFESLIESPDVDAVFVLSPPRFHVDQSLRALASGKHVLVEKPVGTTVAEVRRLRAAARRSGLICMPGHTDAYVPEFSRVRELARSGRLGALRLVAMFYANAHTESVAGHYDGALRTVLPHHAYVMHGMLGMPEAVSAGTTEPAWDALATVDQAWIALDYPPYTTALLFATMGADDDTESPWSCVLKAIGTAGSASGSWRTGVVRALPGGVSASYAPVEAAFASELDAFVAAVNGDSSLVASTLDDAVAAEIMIEAAERSIRTGRRVRLRGATT